MSNGTSKKDLEKKSLDTLSDLGTKFTIKGVGSFSIKPAKLRTLVEISKVSVNISIEKKDAASLMEAIALAPENAKIAAKMVALAILRDKWKMKLFSGILARKLYNNLTAKELYELVVISINQSDSSFFFRSLTLIGSIRITKPMGT